MESLYGLINAFFEQGSDGITPQEPSPVDNDKIIVLTLGNKEIEEGIKHKTCKGKTKKKIAENDKKIDYIRLVR